MWTAAIAIIDGPTVTATWDEGTLHLEPTGLAAELDAWISAGPVLSLTPTGPVFVASIAEGWVAYATILMWLDQAYGVDWSNTSTDGDGWRPPLFAVPDGAVA